MGPVMKRLTGATLKADTIGGLSAVFSVFDQVDTDGDVVKGTAFTDGQEVPLVWAHEWDKPIGKGAVRVEADRAVFDGAFFLDTSWGRDAYATVKAMGALQEYSWGFRILEQSFGEQDGKPVRFIDGAEVFEVSPVLVGANRNTGTLAIKRRAEAKGGDGSVRASQSYEALIEALALALGDAYGYDAYFMPVATFADHAVVCRYEADGRHYYDVPYSRDAEGFSFGAVAPMEPGYLPLEASDIEAVVFAGQLERARALVEVAGKRAGLLADLRRKEGRALSSARRTQLEGLADSLAEAADTLRALLDETSPKGQTDRETQAGDLSHPVTRRGEMLAILARLSGVRVEEATLNE